MPAPAVIPALIAYVKVVAVKTLVVGLRPSESTDLNQPWPCRRVYWEFSEQDVGQVQFASPVTCGRLKGFGVWVGFGSFGCWVWCVRPIAMIKLW